MRGLLDLHLVDLGDSIFPHGNVRDLKRAPPATQVRFSSTPILFLEKQLVGYPSQPQPRDFDVRLRSTKGVLASLTGLASARKP